MTPPDYVALSLTLHGAIFIGAVAAAWKLGGESKFGTEKVTDLHNLRPKLLKSVAAAFEVNVNPILTTTSVTDVELDADGNMITSSPRLSVKGKEALTNVVRDFIKSDSQGLLDLRIAEELDSLLTKNLHNLRMTVWWTFAMSGVFLLANFISKYGCFDLSNGWYHAIPIVILIPFLIRLAFLFLSILMASGKVENLKSKYADLP